MGGINGSRPCFIIVTSETAELLQWLSGEDDEQDDFSSDLVLPIDAFGPDLENADGDLSDALSDLANTELFPDWTQ
jgi:hypothetical protein